MTLDSWDGKVLCATGRSNAGADVKSCLPGCGIYRKALDGSGKLYCLPAPGSWKKSCKVKSYDGIKLKALCSEGNAGLIFGADSTTTTLSGCRNFQNIHGHLSCDDPPGDWKGKCNPKWYSYDEKADVLTAECYGVLEGPIVDTKIPYAVSWSGCGSAGYTMGSGSGPIDKRTLTCPLPGGSWRNGGGKIRVHTATYDRKHDILCAETLSGVDEGVFSDSNEYKRTCASKCKDFTLVDTDLSSDGIWRTAHISCNINNIAAGGVAAAGVQCRDLYASDGQICGTCRHPSTGGRARASSHT